MCKLKSTSAFYNTNTKTQTQHKDSNNKKKGNTKQEEQK